MTASERLVPDEGDANSEKEERGGISTVIY